VEEAVVVVGPCQEEASFLWEDERCEDMRMYMYEYKMCASKITNISHRLVNKSSTKTLLGNYWIG
jgi:hypothetical protein